MSVSAVMPVTVHSRLIGQRRFTIMLMSVITILLEMS
jgi:hypothetical protein